MGAIPGILGIILIRTISTPRRIRFMNKHQPRYQENQDRQEETRVKMVSIYFPYIQ